MSLEDRLYRGPERANTIPSIILSGFHQAPRARCRHSWRTFLDSSELRHQMASKDNGSRADRSNRQHHLFLANQHVALSK